MNEQTEPVYPITVVDRFLKDNGYCLLDEDIEAVKSSNVSKDYPVLDIATGNGRMAFVLASLGFTTITGDISSEVLTRAINRVAEFFPGKLSFTILDALSLPYPDGSFHGITSANALHELSNPMKMIQEMTRVCNQDGTILVLDFNENGFDMISKAHLNIQNKKHRRGSANYDEIDAYLRNHFREVDFYKLPLNNYWVAHQKM